MPIIDVHESFITPGPGAWELETTHLSRPMSRWLMRTFPEAATEGFRAGTKRYGLLLEAMEFTTVNGFVYICARGVGAPKGAKGHPPKFIFKLLSKMQPEVRRRIRRSAEVFETKLWRKDVEEWDNVTKPGFTKRYTALQAVDAASLSDQELSKHLDDCRDADRQSVVIHHTWNSVAMIPMGDFLIQTTKGPECARPI